MKKINYVLFSLFFTILGSNFLIAQDESASPLWYITIGAHATDHTSVRGFADGFFETDNYSIYPPLTRLTVARRLNNSLMVDFTGSFGEIDNKRLKLQDRTFVNAGFGLRYNFSNGYILKENHWFDPYARVGINYHYYDYSDIEIGPNSPYQSYDDDELSSVLKEDVSGNKSHLGLSLGLGINLWVTRRFGAYIASDYNWLPESGTDYFDFFQHSIGVAFKFGKENEEIEKEEVVKELTNNNMCLDTDGDSVCDDKDKCPDVFGSVENEGCPEPEIIDTDGDGIADSEDSCPSVFGVASTNKECNGCPDTDNDGVCDSKDKCPEDPENQCILLDVQQKIENVLFNFGTTVVSDISTKDLTEAASLLTNPAFSNFYWVLEGHTDSVGSNAFNKNLSENRANAIKQFLISKGVDGSKIKAIGYGEDLPIRPNDTDEGRQANRRVEFIPSDSNFNPIALKVSNTVSSQIINKLAKKIYFKTGSFNLEPASEVSLNRIAEYIKNSTKTWEIGGHTDNTGNEANNIELSEKRAQAVVSYLISKGVSASKLTAKGYGSAKPIDTNDTNVGRVNNRRIEFN